MSVSKAAIKELVRQESVKLVRSGGNREAEAWAAGSAGLAALVAADGGRVEAAQGAPAVLRTDKLSAAR